MQLVEFTAYWPGDYTPEIVSVYEMTIGPDRSHWPPTNSYSPIVIDISLICRFNPAYEDKVVVDLTGGTTITLAIEYKEFKKILAHFGITISNFTNAIQDSNKSV